MSPVKTVIVFLKFKMQDHHDWTHTSENSIFGDGRTYPTAHSFIEQVRELHRSTSSSMEITNVVIG